MINRVIASLGVIAMLTVAFAARSAAQVKVELGASIGHYAPLGSFSPASVYWTQYPNQPSSLSGTALGGQLRVWVAPRFGIQVAAATASSVIGGSANPGGYEAPLAARVSMATVEMLFQVTGTSHRTRVWLDAGGAAVRHGGAVYESSGSPVNIGGVVGIGSAIPITRPLSLDLGVKTLVYGLHMSGPDDNPAGHGNGNAGRRSVLHGAGRQLSLIKLPRSDCIDAAMPVERPRTDSRAASFRRRFPR